MTQMFFIREQGKFFLVYEDCALNVGDVLDSDEIDQFKALMSFEETEELLLKVLDAVYRQGRRDQRAATARTLRSRTED